MAEKILVTDDVHSLLLEGLRTLGHVDYAPGISPEEVLHSIESYTGLIINSKIHVNHDFLQRAKKLNWIGRLGSGLDCVDISAVKAFQGAVLRSPEGNANAVGEHALGMLLSLLNKIPAGHQMVKAMEPWDREAVRGRQLDGLTVGIVGFGHTGPAFAKKLAGFDVKVLVYDKYKKHLEPCHRFQEETDIHTLLNNSDVVSMHIPLTDETRFYVDGKFLDQLKSGAIFINTSRGGIVHLSDLTDRLVSGQVAGVCLDVFENEKPNSYTEQQRVVMQKLSGHPHAVLTPHVAGWTDASKLKIAEVLLKKIMCVIKGKSV